MDIKNLLPQNVVDPNGQVSFRTQSTPKILQFIQAGYSGLPVGSKMRSRRSIYSFAP